MKWTYLESMKALKNATRVTTLAVGIRRKAHFNGLVEFGMEEKRKQWRGSFGV